MKKFFAFLAVIVTALLLASCGGGGGDPGVQGPSTRLRMTPSFSALSLTAGTFSDVAKISRGVGDYHVISSNTAVVTGTIPRNSDGTLRLFGLLPGTATVTVQDSSTNQQSISLDVTVQALPPLYIFPVLSSVTMVPGSKFYFTVGGGSPPYAVGSAGLVSVACADPVYVTGQTEPLCPSHRYVATAGLTTGTDTITIADQYRFGTPDDTISISVTVQAPTVALKVSPTALPGAPGTTGELMITGGVPPYRVSSSNPSVATAGQPTADGRVTVRLIDAGTGTATSTITVVDATGASVTSTVTVKSDPFTVTPDTNDLRNPDGAGGPSAFFAIQNGSGSYTVEVPTTAQALISATTGGTTTVTVTRVQNSAACVTSDTPVPITVTDTATKQKVTVIVVLKAGATAVCP